MFKRIDHTDVAYEYGKILDISVLKVKTNGKWKLCEDIDISAPIVSRGTKVKKKKKRIRDRWSKYIK
jgi:hypothetical protein